jgi:hypothetical protein
VAPESTIRSPRPDSAGRRGEVEAIEAPRRLSGVVPGDLIGRSIPARVVRTDEERREFADAWAKTGVALSSGDSYYRCPFHDGRDVSLHVDAELCRWYCFGCRIGGGLGRLRRRLGDRSPTTLRSRLRGFVGTSRPITLTGGDPVKVVGESFHQEELLRLTGGIRRYGGVDVEAVAELIPLAGDGTEVRIDDSIVGYLAHADAERFAALLQERCNQRGLATCRSVIRGGWDRGGDHLGLFGVTLYLPSTSVRTP